MVQLNIYPSLFHTIYSTLNLSELDWKQLFVNAWCTLVLWLSLGGCERRRHGKWLQIVWWHPNSALLVYIMLLQYPIPAVRGLPLFRWQASLIIHCVDNGTHYFWLVVCVYCQSIFPVATTKWLPPKGYLSLTKAKSTCLWKRIETSRFCSALSALRLCWNRFRPVVATCSVRNVLEESPDAQPAVSSSPVCLITSTTVVSGLWGWSAPSQPTGASGWVTWGTLVTT